jgi:hypothetical protein
MTLGRLNREKTVFLGSFAALALAAGYAALSGPGARDVGEERVGTTAPGRIGVALCPARADELELWLGGPNPYAPARKDTGSQRAGAGRSEERVQGDRRDVPPPPPPPDPQDGDRRRKPVDVAIYEVPVDFRAVMRGDDGRHLVVLETKSERENRHLREGDVWPETGLTIVKVTMTSVLLENGRGERFLMRDLYARKARPDGKGTDPGRS